MKEEKGKKVKLKKKQVRGFEFTANPNLRGRVSYKYGIFCLRALELYALNF